MDLGRRACLSVFWVLLLVSCEFSISDLLSLKSGLGDMICQFAIARQLATPLLSSRFLIFSLEEKLLWHC